MLKTHYGETLLLLLSLVMGLIMAAAVILLDGIALNISNVFKIWAMISLVIILVSIFLPYKNWSAAFCRRLGLKEGTLAWKLADGIIPSLVLNTFNTAIVSGANIFYNEAIPASEQMSHWVQGFVRDWPVTFVISYFAAFVAEYCGKLAADKYAGHHSITGGKTNMIIKTENMILDLLVQTDPKGIVELESEAGIVRMIPFAGTVSGPLFWGIIEPCGVDTQITNAADVRHMSARYMLTGTDHTGSSCHIYVQNEAWFTDGARPRPWHSVPTFITDSKALAPILHGSSFIGEGIRDHEGLHIRFYKAES